MSSGVTREQSDAAIDLAAWVDDIADRFEAAWQSLTPPDIAHYLGDATGERREILEAELVKLDAEYRRLIATASAAVAAVGQPAQSVPSGHAHPASRRLVTAESTTSSLSSWPTVLGFEILAELGHGGMGVVYRSRQTDLNRIVALKMIGSGACAGAKERSRFRAEAQAAAGLQHPHIVTIYDVGEQDGLPFLVQEFVDGGTLAQRLGGAPQPPPLAAELVETLARAVQYAHDRGVVHRDLKPANILLAGREREGPDFETPQPPVVQAPGLSGVVPKITDFGLAKVLAAESRTLTGEILGTPNYMAPEQAEGRARDVGPAADVYALGAILYECLTGRPPFQGETTLDTLEQVRTQEPIAPSRLRPKLPRDLSTICLKCLQKDWRKRYATAADFADDLRRFIERRPIHARPVGRTERLWRWCRRNPVVAGLLGGVAVLLVAAVSSSTIAAVNAVRREREQKRENLIQQVELLRQSAHQAHWSAKAWNHVIEAARIDRDSLLQSQAATTLAGIDGTRVKHFKDQAASSVLFDAADRRLLMGGTAARRERPALPARLWDSATDELVESPHSGPGPVAFACDGTPLQLVNRDDHSLLLWDLTKQKRVCECRFDAEDVEGLENPQWDDLVMALADDGSYVAAALSGPHASRRGLLAIWDTASGKPLFKQGVAAKALAFSSDKALLAAGDEQGRVTIWSMPDGKQVEVIQSMRPSVHCLAFSRDSRLLAAGGGGGTLTVWDRRQKLPVSDCRGSAYDVSAIAFSPDGTTLASAGRYEARIWDVATGRLLLEFADDLLDFASGLTFSSDGRRLAGSSQHGFSPGNVLVWELEDGRGIRTLRGLRSHVTKVRFSSNGKLLASLDQDWRVAIWDVAGGHLRGLLDVPQGDTADNAALVFSPDGRYFAFSTCTEARLWDLDTGREVRTWPLPIGYQDALAFHATGKLLLFRFETRDGKPVCSIRDLLGADPTRRLAEITTFDRICFIVAPAGGSCFVVDGRLGTGEQRSLLAAFDSINGRELWHVPDVGEPRLDPAGKLLSYHGDTGGREFLVNLPSGAFFDDFSPAQGYYLGPGARFLLLPRGPSGIDAETHRISLFRRANPTPLITFMAKCSRERSFAFSPAGDLVAWGGADGSVAVCNIQEVQARLSQIGLGW